MNKNSPVMRWRRRQARWKTYRLHRARRILYRIPPPSGRPILIDENFSFYAGALAEAFSMPPHMLREGGQS